LSGATPVQVRPREPARGREPGCEAVRHLPARRRSASRGLL